MNAYEKAEREVASIILAAVAEEASEEQLVRLNALLTEQPELADFVVDLMSQESWLSWYTARSRNGEIRSELLEHIAQIVQTSLSAPASCVETLAMMADDSTNQVSDRSAGRPQAIPFHLAGWISWGSRYAAALAALLLVAVGVVIGLSIGEWQRDSDVAIGEFPAESSSRPGTGSYIARFVHGTACLWNQEINAALSSDDALRTGESLSLLEGLAELQLDWESGSAALRIEGPAGLVLTAERGASLSHGRFTADVEADSGQFTLNTPNGLIEVVGTASVGVVIAGGNVELHVFKGSAAFVGPTRRLESLVPVHVEEGDAIRIASDSQGRLRIDRDIALPSSFASKVSMGSDHLVIPAEYVREVVSAQPLVYWRFEDKDASVARNEVGDNYVARLAGEADRVREAGNTWLELGAGLSDQALQSYIFCDEPLNADFQEGYSLEVWLKPSHYHWGSAIGFMGSPEQPGWRVPHGLLLEIGGPQPSDSELEHPPGRVRFLHRNPPGGDFNSGTSCFSKDAYELRKWQHIVAVKTSDKLKLYINGELSAQKEDPSTLAPGMRVIVGQLDREQFYRKFIGQVDELAIYSRPLSEKEIIRHYKLIRPSWIVPEAPRKLEQTATVQAVGPSASI